MDQVLRRHGINQQEFLFAPLEDGYTYGKAFYGTVADLLEAAPAYTNETAEAAFVRESLGLAAEKKTYNATHRYFSVLDEMTSLPYLRNKTDGVILKPSDGTNSIGVVWVQLLDGQEALQDYWANSARGATVTARREQPARRSSVQVADETSKKESPHMKDETRPPTYLLFF